MRNWQQRSHLTSKWNTDYKEYADALLDYSEWIASEMADKLFLVVADYNPEAKRFYERNGYHQVGEIPNLYRPEITEYLMAKSLIFPVE